MSTSSTTSSGSSGSRPSAGAAGSRRSSVWIFGLIGVFFIAAVVLIGVLRGGYVSGIEISPDTFDVRTFSYYELPGLHLQLTPVRREDSSSPLAAHLATDKLLQPRPNSTEWHLVSTSRGGVVAHEGEADLLFTFVQRTLFGLKSDWLDWTKKNPETAKVFWPLVGRLSQRREYILAPEIFELARSTTSKAEFEEQAASYLAREYRRWAEAERRAQHDDRAVELLDEGIARAQAQPGKLAEELAALKKLRSSWKPE